MFITRYERQPLGGFFTFILPMVLFGILAAVPLGLNIFGGDVDLLADVPGRALQWLSIFAASLLYLWHFSHGFKVLAVALVISGLTLLGFILNAPAGSVLLGWGALLILGGALANDTEGSLLQVPSYQAIFPRLVSLPLMLVLILLFSLLFGLLITASFQAGMVMTATDLGTGELIPEITGVTRIAVFSVFGVFLGVVSALIRYQRALIGSVRYAVLVAARYVLPFITVIGLMLFFAMLDPYEYTLADRAAAAEVMAIILLTSIMLVYVDGSLPKPPLWLRLTAFLTLITIGLLLLPGLNLALAGEQTWAQSFSYLLTALAGLFLLFGKASDLFSRADTWMPLLAPLCVFYFLIISVSPIALALLS